MLVWCCFKWEVLAHVVRLDCQLGIGKQHGTNKTTRILTGKVACSIGIPFVKKRKKKQKKEKEKWEDSDVTFRKSWKITLFLGKVLSCCGRTGSASTRECEIFRATHDCLMDDNSQSSQHYRQKGGSQSLTMSCWELIKELQSKSEALWSADRISCQIFTRLFSLLRPFQASTVPYLNLSPIQLWTSKQHWTLASTGFGRDNIFLSSKRQSDDCAFVCARHDIEFEAVKYFVQCRAAQFKYFFYHSQKGHFCCFLVCVGFFFRQKQMFETLTRTPQASLFLVLLLT